VNEKRIRRLMRLMGLMPIYQKPNTSKPAKGHRTYPYPLKGLRITRPNQVWASDLTYIPMRRRFLYLIAIIEWNTRKVLSWRIGASWRSGDTTTTMSDHTRCSEIKRPQKRAERLSNLRAPRSARLPKTTMKNMKNRPENSHCKCGSLGAQVSGCVN